MNSEQIVKITADLAVATKLLAQVAEQLAANSCSLNGLVAAGTCELSGCESFPSYGEKLKEDIGFAKNLDILPPVEIKETLKYVGDEIKSSSELMGKSLKNISNEKLELSDDDVWNMAAVEGLTVNEASAWFRETFGVEDDEQLGNQINIKCLMLAYAREYFRHKKAK